MTKPYISAYEGRLLQYETCLNMGVAPEPDTFEDALRDIKDLLLIVKSFESEEERKIKETADRMRYLMLQPKPDYDAHQ